MKKSDTLHSDDFKRAFFHITKRREKLRDDKLLQAYHVNTPLGLMIAIADEEALYLLEFTNRQHLEQKIEHLKLDTESNIHFGETSPIKQIQDELDEYFAGRLTEFHTPLFLSGSPFQKNVWRQLQKIPFGETRSYSDIAVAIGKPSAFRAVAQANGANNFTIIIPCHRVINKNGELGGYSAGLVRKEWLINHELPVNRRKQLVNS